MTNQQVIRAFVERKPGHSGNLHSDGEVLRSYALPVARHNCTAVEVLAHDALPTQTTKCHVSRLWVPLHQAGLDSRRVDRI